MKVKELLMALAIAIMAALFVGLLIDAVYSSPEYEDYCDNNEKRVSPLPERIGVNKTECPDPYFTYQNEINACSEEEGFAEFEYDKNGCQIYGSCNYCSKDFNDANEKYNRNIFFIITPIAIAAIIFGLLYGMEVIGSGFMFAGILLLIYSTGRYFSDMSKTMRVVVIGIELLLLLWITKKKLSNR
ncbi:MAG: hypothetical protein Q8Q42_03915 [Nanoarchaeota archaeon]|nr:hypothetical protein [Nanoarchaeota archaeon]